MADSDPAEAEIVGSTMPPQDPAPADTINDISPRPPAPVRRDTSSTAAGETCRICRSEATPTEPLFHPCKCSGSIKHVHQECLMEWLSHSHKKHCELCKTPFRFTKLYDADMPSKLPWNVFARRAMLHVVVGMTQMGRGAIVGSVWLGVIPWVVRWVWRWLFWFADAAWAREAFVLTLMRQRGDIARINGGQADGGFASTFTQFIGNDFWSGSQEQPLSLRFAKALFGFVDMPIDNTDGGHALNETGNFTWPMNTPSLLSSFSHISNMTPSSTLNRLILDVLEGQLITCVVITGFILVFLIREWVVQQQPIVLQGQFEDVNQRIAEATDRVREENDLLLRQRELLDATRRTVDELTAEMEKRDAEELKEREANGEPAPADQAAEFVGLEKLEVMLDEATAHLRSDDDQAQQRFEAGASEISKQIRASKHEQVSVKDLSEIIHRKLASYSPDERAKWQDMLLREAINFSSSGTASGRRPPLPERDFSSRAMQIERSLVEQEEALREAREAVNNIALPDLPWQTSQQSASSTGRAVDVGNLSNSRSFDPIPITNAGPDAKINIKRRGNGKLRAVPEPKSEIKASSESSAQLSVEAETQQTGEQAPGDAEDDHFSGRQDASDEATHGSPILQAEGNPFHPDGALPERRDSDSFGNRVASVFREEFGLDEAEELESLRQAGIDPETLETAENDGNNDRAALLAEHARRTSTAAHAPTLTGRIVDWFWGDIEPREAPTERDLPDAVAVDHPQPEGQDDGEEQEAPFVPVQDGHPVLGHAAEPEPPVARPDQPAHDPEVLAAAQQAGLDPEAIEDAEDLEGIFELLGLQGPLIGLFQTSAFCMLLVTCTIMGAVIAPYLIGKLVLSLIGSPVYFLVKMPLQTASFVADLIVDLALLSSAWVIMVVALATDFILSAAQTWAPSLGRLDFTDAVVNFATNVARNAGVRLSGLFPTTIPVPAEGMIWSWAFLGWSAHAHAELKNIGSEVHAILHAAGAGITWVVETISSGRVREVCWHAMLSMEHTPVAIAYSKNALKAYAMPLVGFAKDLSHGSLNITVPQLPADPSLVYWSTSDRALAVTTGYTALACIAALYVAIDTPITNSPSGQRTEKLIRDALRQAGGVLKVILIISIEMLVFPLYCGMLLDLAFLPLFKEATVASRWHWAGEKPYAFCFMHWFVGTCYMFHFALFVGMCRKILRKGVLWFVRDPDDPTFHPVRDVLERNVATQLRKIAFSALVYGALVILCLGGVVWACVRVLDGVFPIVWTSTEPVVEFPINLFLYNFVTPLLIKLFKPTDAMSGVYAWWLRKCARALRLSDFLFGERKLDEEGHLRHDTWASYLPWSKDMSRQSTAETSGIEAGFERNGKYVLTPCSDQYRPPKAGEAFLYVEDDDVYIADRDGKKSEHFGKVYVPPLFRLRVSVFMICLWLFSALTGLGSTIVPLVLGRKLLGQVLPNIHGVNDIYSYSVGAYSLTGIGFLIFKGQPCLSYLTGKAKAIDTRVWFARVGHFVAKTLKCIYFYGFLGLVMPLVFALLLQFYLVVPVQTMTNSVSELGPTREEAMLNMTSPSFNLTALLAERPDRRLIVDSSFHILQGYALGMVYGRVAMRMILTTPASRAAEAFRRITADGYFNPNLRLATRFFILPAMLISAFLLCAPPLAAKLFIMVVTPLLEDDIITSGRRVSDLTRTAWYRYSYPLAASIALIWVSVAELARLTSAWRARIRDEVYLVGERLHNFREEKPPVGSRSVVRKNK